MDTINPWYSHLGSNSKFNQTLNQIGGNLSESVSQNNASSMAIIGQIEQEIKNLAVKARDNKITLEDMSGGTFTITNGGVFGSMMSTPIINPPQSAILGMHNVVERPMAVNGKVEIRPIMYVALSYDHRIIDGRESVGFLVKVKEMLENPHKMLFGGKDPDQILLGL